MATRKKATPKKKAVPARSVEAWLETKTSGWQGKTVKAVLALVKATAPESTVVIKWGQPVTESNGPMAYVRPATEHVTFGFWRGAELADPDGLLEGEGALMRHLKLGKGPLDTKRLSAFVKQAVALNAKKGSAAFR